MKVAGINLTTIKDISSICLIENQNLSTFSARTNEQILEVLNNSRPKVIAINAPLFLKEEMRECEKEIVKSGFNFSLRDFSEREEIWGRAIRIKNVSERYAEVIETNSDVLRQIFKNIEAMIKKFNLNQMNLIRNENEKIAILCAITALLYEKGEYQRFGREEDGFIILPKFNSL